MKSNFRGGRNGLNDTKGGSTSEVSGTKKSKFHVINLARSSNIINAILGIKGQEPLFFVEGIQKHKAQNEKENSGFILIFQLANCNANSESNFFRPLKIGGLQIWCFHLLPTSLVYRSTCIRARTIK